MFNNISMMMEHTGDFPVLSHWKKGIFRVFLFPSWQWFIHFIVFYTNVNTANTIAEVTQQLQASSSVCSQGWVIDWKTYRYIQICQKFESCHSLVSTRRSKLCPLVCNNPSRAHPHTKPRPATHTIKSNVTSRQQLTKWCIYLPFQ